jgi:hypothetical protein
MTIDVDSTIYEVHGHHKGGAAYGYTRQLGYHPLLATRADTGEMLHIRMRKGSANAPAGRAVRQRAGWPGTAGRRGWGACPAGRLGLLVRQDHDRLPAHHPRPGPDLEYRLGEYLGMANQQA